MCYFSDRFVLSECSGSLYLLFSDHESAAEADEIPMEVEHVQDGCPADNESCPPDKRGTGSDSGLSIVSELKAVRFSS